MGTFSVGLGCPDSRGSCSWLNSPSLMRSPEIQPSYLGCVEPALAPSPSLPQLLGTFGERLSHSKVWIAYNFPAKIPHKGEVPLSRETETSSPSPITPFHLHSHRDTLSPQPLLPGDLRYATFQLCNCRRVPSPKVTLCHLCQMKTLGAIEVVTWCDIT